MKTFVVLIALAGCGTTAPDVVAQLADLGLACESTHPCPAGTECGTCGIGLGQCIAPCDATGSAGCPTGAYCSEAFTNTTTHICVRECIDDIDCHTSANNPALSCNDPYTEPGTNHDDISVCGTETATTATCP
jgi:hypothetical protein